MRVTFQVVTLTDLHNRLQIVSLPKMSSALNYLQLERSSAILLDRPAHPFSMVCFTFMALVSALFLLIRSLIVSRTALAAENLALRQQLAVLNRKIHRPQLHQRDRFFWVILSQLWKNWREVLIIVKPETVLKWHRQGFKLYWRWKSKAPLGRPKIDKEIRELIKWMSLENPLWGTPRIQSELRLLGFDLAESTVAKYRVRCGASPSQTWKTVLANHAKQIAAIDFFVMTS
jgi:putative transposase